MLWYWHKILNFATEIVSSVPTYLKKCVVYPYMTQSFDNNKQLKY